MWTYLRRKCVALFSINCEEYIQKKRKEKKTARKCTMNYW